MRERKEEEENMTKLYIAHSLKEEMISTCYYDRVTSKYESQNSSTYIHTKFHRKIGVYSERLIITK